MSAMAAFAAAVVPAVNFILLVGVGLELTASDFARVRRQPALVLAGLLAPVLVLPLIGLLLTSFFEARPAVAGGCC